MAGMLDRSPEILCLLLMIVTVTFASDDNLVNVTKICGGSLTSDKMCSNQTSAQELKTVLRKCCESGEGYDTTKRTCVRFSPELENSSFVFLARNESGFDEVISGMPNCSSTQVLIDIKLTSDSFKGIDFEEFKSETLCVDRNIANVSLVGRRCVEAKQFCEKNPCLRKCCGPGAYMKGKQCTKENSDRGFNITFHNASIVNDNDSVPIDDDTEYGTYHGSACQVGKYPLFPEKNVNDSFYITKGGVLMMPRVKRNMTTDEFCLENVYIPNRMDGMYAFICFQKKDQKPDVQWEVHYTLIALGLIISCVFLVATFLVYLFLPSLQNIHGMTLMCHVASFLVAFLCLATVQIGFDKLQGQVCLTIGFLMLFAFLASFAWMNIMCFDIWWTFGGVRSLNHSSRKSQIRKKFAWYSLYAWGIPIVITGAAICCELVEGLVPDVIKPHMAYNSCWFQNSKIYGRLLFFIIPIALLIACNVVLFVLTARNCSRVKSEINRMQKSTDERYKKKFQADKEKLMMNGKLFVVMGVSWTIEVITLFFPKDSVPLFWTYIPDTFNSLQGVAIFAIFVLKSKVLNALADRLGIKRKKSDSTSPDNNASCRRQIRDPFNQKRKTSASSTCGTTITTIGSVIMTGICKNSRRSLSSVHDSENE